MARSTSKAKGQGLSICWFMSPYLDVSFNVHVVLA